MKKSFIFAVLVLSFILMINSVYGIDCSAKERVSSCNEAKSCGDSYFVSNGKNIPCRIEGSFCTPNDRDCREFGCDICSMNHHKGKCSFTDCPEEISVNSEPFYRQEYQAGFEKCFYTNSEKNTESTCYPNMDENDRWDFSDSEYNCRLCDRDGKNCDGVYSNKFSSPVCSNCDCPITISIPSKEICDNNIDDDDDNKIDCRDDGCEGQACKFSDNTEGACIKKLCIAPTFAELTVDEDYLNHLNIDKNDYLEKTEIPKDSGEKHLIVSPYDKLKCGTRFKGIGNGDLTQNEIEKISKQKFSVEFWLTGQSQKTGICEPVQTDYSRNENSLSVIYECNHIFQELGDKSRGRKLNCLVFPKELRFRQNLGNLPASIVSEDIVIAEYLYYFIPINQDSYGNLENWWSFYLKLSEINKRIDLAGKKIKVNPQKYVDIAEICCEYVSFLNKKYDWKTVKECNKLSGSIVEDKVCGEKIGWGYPQENIQIIYHFLTDSVIKGRFNQDKDVLSTIMTPEFIGRQAYDRISADDGAFASFSVSLFKGFRYLMVVLSVNSSDSSFSHEVGHYIGNFADEYDLWSWVQQSITLGKVNPISPAGTIRFPLCCSYNSPYYSECDKKNGICVSNCNSYGLEKINYNCGSDAGLQCCKVECSSETPCPGTDEKCACDKGKCANCKTKGGKCVNGQCDYGGYKKECDGFDESCFYSDALKKCVDCTETGERCTLKIITYKNSKEKKYFCSEKCKGDDTSCYFNRETKECENCQIFKEACWKGSLCKFPEVGLTTNSLLELGFCGSPDTCLGMPYNDKKGKEPDDVNGPFGFDKKAYSIMGARNIVEEPVNVVYPENAKCPLKNC